jgi:glutamate synthase domain-containing protein 3
MANIKSMKINGVEKDARVDSRILEERIQKAVAEGYRHIEVTALGQHGIGGRLWRAHNEKVQVNVLGTSGQRLGSMGFPNTVIEAFGPASDDVGWLNAGAQIIVHGNATNGVANGMAQGKVYIDGDIGARGMTMTKHNPRFEPPELWVFGKVGDSFAEFMAGGIAVICGSNAEQEPNVLGHHPCVGMVGGKIYFRGRQDVYSAKDAKWISCLPDDEWGWLQQNLKIFLQSIGKRYLFEQLANRLEWHLLVARKPSEKSSPLRLSVAQFRKEVWEQELGKGGLIGDLSSLDRSASLFALVGKWQIFTTLSGLLSDRYSRSEKVGADPERKIGRGRQSGAGVHTSSGHGLRLSVSQFVHAELQSQQSSP